MGACQWLIIGICTFLNALDGYDVLTMAFTATPVTEEFGLSGSGLGFLLSAGLLGMAVGSLTVVALILVVALMPESAAYLHNRR
ncbi:hypothetical protein [Citricoccus sp. K5]|uniref:hypothetical protein n=1 Tax=Citricoccus sp. K5 TaxID=2653135 RepID=UPI0012F1A466|nr:hypothetical protein [Citricoccus sp. K5]VXB00644.1 hypothetical protein CITRIK5_20072 [Citricoccus sp. K5]